MNEEPSALYVLSQRISVHSVVSQGVLSGVSECFSGQNQAAGSLFSDSPQQRKAKEKIWSLVAVVLNMK